MLMLMLMIILRVPTLLELADADVLQAEWDASVDALHSLLSFVPPPKYRCLAAAQNGIFVMFNSGLPCRSPLQRQQHGDA
jgi:hypothetical protein